MINKPLVSVVIPIFNSEKYIADTIESVLNQTYSNIEVIVVDDCSTDNSYNILSDISCYDSRVRVYRNLKNFGGPAQPRNIGISKSNGEYIAFLDADDLWVKNKLEIQISNMISNNYNFTSTGQMNIDQYGYFISKKNIISRIKRFIVPKRSISDLILWKYIALSSVVLKRELLVDEFSESIDHIAVEDYYLWLKLLNNNIVKYKYIDDCLLFYRVLNDSISNGNQKNRHRVKSLLVESKFILEYQRYDLYPYVIKGLIFNLLSSMKNRL